MSTKKNRKQTIGIRDIWAICGLYALLLVLFVIPGIIIEGQPISALQLMRADELYQFGGFPGHMRLAHEIAILPVLSLLGLLLTLLFRNTGGKYAFGISISMLLFGMIGVFSAKALPNAGGFVIGAGMFISAAQFFLCTICAVIRR